MTVFETAASSGWATGVRNGRGTVDAPGDCFLPTAPPGFEPGIYAFKERDVAVTPQGNMKGERWIFRF